MFSARFTGRLKFQKHVGMLTRKRPSVLTQTTFQSIVPGKAENSEVRPLVEDIQMLAQLNDSLLTRGLIRLTPKQY